MNILKLYSSRGRITISRARFVRVPPNAAIGALVPANLNRVVVGEDGQKAADMVIREAPDLILRDMSLPVIDGWQATRRIKAAPETAGIPVIALTAHTMASDRQKALDAGCGDDDTKPVELDRLPGKIDALLNAGG